MNNSALFTEKESEAVLKPFSDASFLPPRAYADPAVFDFEKTELFRKNWIPVARTSEIPNPGDYISRDMFGESMVVMRDENGDVKAFSNVCRHRARRIVDAGGNCSATKRLTCPYHAWSYGQDGQLKSAPYMEKTPGFSVTDWRLPCFAVDVWLGFIFINFDEKAKPLSPQLQSLTKILEPLGLEGMVVQDFCKYQAPWNWKATMDNFTEGYHQPTIHGTSIEPTIPCRLATYDDVDGPYSLFWMPAAEGVEFQSILPDIDGIPEKFKGGITIVNVYPLLHLLIDQSSVMWLDWDIRGVNDHDIIWRLMVPESTTKLADFEAKKKSLYAFLKTVWDEDVSACKGVADGAQSLLAQQGRMCYQEKSVYQFHQWVMTEYTKSGTKA